jgi:hypothetical protein
MDVAGRYLVVWFSPEAIETFLGVLEPAQERAMTTWTVAGRSSGSQDLGCGFGCGLRRRRPDDGGAENTGADAVGASGLRGQGLAACQLQDSSPAPNAGSMGFLQAGTSRDRLTSRVSRSSALGRMVGGWCESRCDFLLPIGSQPSLSASLALDLHPPRRLRHR